MVLRSLLLAAITVGALLGATNAAAQGDEYYDTRDWKGMRRDLYYLIGWQVVATVIVYNAPFEVSNWNREEKDNLGFEQWRRNVTDPVWDEDHWAMNYVVHPYWGAGYYIRGRERGFSERESFWVSVLYSSVYEFGIESFLEEPSIQDLIVTPIAGTFLGRYFERVRERIRAKPAPLSFSDKLKLGLTDPLGALNRGVNRVFGIEESSDSQLIVGFRPIPALRQNENVANDTDGFMMTFSYRW